MIHTAPNVCSLGKYLLQSLRYGAWERNKIFAVVVFKRSSPVAYRSSPADIRGLCDAEPGRGVASRGKPFDVVAWENLPANVFNR
jgi:hypothetical protein